MKDNVRMKTGSGDSLELNLGELLSPTGVDGRLDTPKVLPTRKCQTDIVCM